MVRKFFLTTRVNEAELAILRQAAKEQGRPLTNFVRYVALQAAKQAATQGGAHA